VIGKYEMINILYLHAGAEMYGADKVMFDLVRNLDKTRFKPYVVLPTNGVLVEALKNEGIEVEVIPYPIMRRKYFNPKGILQYGLSLIKYGRILSKYARKRNINVVHTNTSAVLEGCKVSKSCGIPQLWEIHEIIVNPKIMYKITSWLVAKYATVTIAVSQAVQQHLYNSGYFKRGSVKVIYNGVDANRFNPNTETAYLRKEWNIPENSPVIGMIGRVNRWKGQNDFLQAANILLKKHTDLYVAFVGSSFEGEEWREQELRENIDKSPYKDRIIFSEYRKDVESIHSLFDVFVLPSTNPDPLPTVVLEAMSCGKPVVGYRHGGICEMVKDGYNGLLADVNNPKDLAEKIDTILSNSEMRETMGEHSRSRLLEKFSYASYVNNFSAEYERLANVNE
jgi:glycosyltransferase involved in cell wall biosynthesis